jgi:hypothetical protein
VLTDDRGHFRSLRALSCRGVGRARLVSEAQPGLAVTPEQFVALAERLETARVAAKGRHAEHVETSLAQWRAKHGPKVP